MFLCKLVVVVNFALSIDQVLTWWSSLCASWKNWSSQGTS